MADDHPPTRRYKSPADLSRSRSPPPSSPSSPTTRHARITSTSTTTTSPTAPRRRNPPYLPTPTELALLALYPALLAFGTLFSLLSPETRAAPYDRSRQAHVQDAALAPSYFARKDNLFNVLFVKRGWAWITVSFFVFIFTHPAVRGNGSRLVRAGVRWGVVTTWWVFVTQWFFGPAIIDRGFRWSGGRCEVVEEQVFGSGQGQGEVGVKEVVTAAACKASGGSWRGGHDISGHVFLLVLGSFFLVQEVGWVAARWARYLREERSVVMHDGAVKGAGVEVDRRERQEEGVVLTVLDALGHGGRLAAAVVVLCGWMLLMTAIYFHTWFEKLTGLLVALAGLYVTYILPRWVPALRRIVGLPGI